MRCNIETGDILKQALTKGHNEHPSKLRYEFDKHTQSGQVKAYVLNPDGTQRINRKGTGRITVTRLPEYFEPA